MTPEEVAERRRQEQALVDAERAKWSERTRAILEARPFVPEPLTPEQEIRRRFEGDGIEHGCGTAADFESQMGGLEHWCGHMGLLAIAEVLALSGRPATAVLDLVGRRLHNSKFSGGYGFRSVELVSIVDEPGSCVCPHDCEWVGALREMWVQGGTVVCPACHKACIAP
jgi:hypothetical protein